MAEYEAPKLGERFRAKYVRFGKHLFTGPKDDTDIEHETIARIHHLMPQLQATRQANPNEIDAGRYGIDDTEILVYSESSKLELPITPEARSRSVLLFQEKSPGFIVEGDLINVSFYEP